MYISPKIKDMIRHEGGFPLSDTCLEKLLSDGEEIILGKEEYIIEPGTIDKNIWITFSGVSKAVYFNGKKPCIIGFSGPATITMSPICQILGRPAFCGFQTVTECILLRINKKRFDQLMEESAEFSRWMYGIMISQFCALELKIQLLSEGDIVNNFKAVIKRQMKLDSEDFDRHRNDLLRVVSSKDLASYLGITQSYLSNIRKAIIEDERNKNNSN